MAKFFKAPAQGGAFPNTDRFVQLISGEAALATATSGNVGVAIGYNSGTNFVTIQTKDLASVETGADCSEGDYLQSDDNGKAIPAKAMSTAPIGAMSANTVSSGTNVQANVSLIGVLSVAQPVDPSGVPLSTQSGPRSSDDKQIVLPNQFDSSVQAHYCGIADDITNGVRFGGARLTMTSSVAGGETKVFSWQHHEWFYIAGGMIHTMSGEPGDHLTYKVFAPASTATVNGTDTGDYDKVDVGGSVNMLVPNTDSTGGWDVDLSAKLNANVGFTAVVPVPASAEDGWYDWDYDTELVTQNLAQTGKYNLFDARVDIASLITGLGTMGSMMHDLRLSAVNPKRILAHWRHEATWVVGNAASPDNITKHVEWVLLSGRLDTA